MGNGCLSEAIKKVRNSLKMGNVRPLFVIYVLLLVMLSMGSVSVLEGQKLKSAIVVTDCHGILSVRGVW